MKYLFPSPLFQSMCILCPKVGLLEATYCRPLFFFAICHSMSFDWSSLLTCKLNIDKYVFTAILNLFFQLILYFSTVSFFCFTFYGLMMVLLYACILFFCVCMCVCVNLFYVFDFWLPCFSSILTPSLETAMATHSSTLAWKIPWEEPGRLQSVLSLRIGHD